MSPFFGWVDALRCPQSTARRNHTFWCKSKGSMDMQQTWIIYQRFYASRSRIQCEPSIIFWPFQHKRLGLVSGLDDLRQLCRFVTLMIILSYKCIVLTYTPVFRYTRDYSHYNKTAISPATTLVPTATNQALSPSVTALPGNSAGGGVVPFVGVLAGGGKLCVAVPLVFCTLK